jgi:hypothetical protein
MDPDACMMQPCRMQTHTSSLSACEESEREDWEWVVSTESGDERGEKRRTSLETRFGSGSVESSEMSKEKEKVCCL